MNIVAALRRVALAIALPVLLLATQAANACTGGGCVVAGPRLASVNSSQGALLNALLGSLLGSNVNVSVLDWNAIAGGNVSLLSTINALQATLGVSTPATALNTPITIGQLTAALSTAASQAGNTSLAASLGNLVAQVNVPGTIKLGDLLTSDGIVGTTQINALSLIDGAAQLFNGKNVATTPTAINVTGAQLGQSSLANISIQVQAVEPPVYVCGPAGTTFHSSALRLKLGISLASVSLNTSTLTSLLGTTSLTLGTFSVYVEVAHASGVISAVNAITNAMTVQATPGIASIYLGTFSDLQFFDRTHTINPATDLTPGTIAQLQLVGQTIGVYAKAAVTGVAPTPTTFNFSGTGVQSQTATTSGLTATTLLTSLVGNLQITIAPSLGNVLDPLVIPLLSTLITGVVNPVLDAVLPTVLDPLMSLVGIRIGEVDISSGGTYLECAVAGCVYNDVNHNARQDSGETGTGTTLYAKLINPATPTVASVVATVDPTTGNYAFPTLNPATYTVVISTSSATSSITPLAPTGWIGTQSPTLSKSITVAAADLVAQSFGLYHGSSLAGSVFKDNGSGTGGIANNGVRDGGELALGGVTVNVTDSTGATAWDSEKTDPTGAYVAWIPYTAGTGMLKVSQAADPTMAFVSGNAGTTGGAFALAGATTSFTHVIGSIYTGVNFGDVPINRLDTDGQQSVAAGTTAIYAHVFHAGSAGQLSFAVAPLTTPPVGWNATVYLDANCNGQLDAGDTLLTAARAVVADQAVCVIVKVFAPLTAANDTRTTFTLTASFAYANNTLTSQATRGDLTIVGAADGLQLVKSVDKSVAASGAVITYTLTYTNLGSAAVSAVKIRDATPAWTLLNAAGCGALPTGITACNVTAQPAAGAAGSVEWTLTGSLPSGGTGTVVFSVTVQ